MFSNIGPGMLILIGLVALVIFGPKKLPELGRSIGSTLKEFKKGTEEVFNDEPKVMKVETEETGNQSSQRPSLKTVEKDKEIQ